MKLGGRLAVITGGNAGLGLAAATHLVKDKGMRVALIDRGFSNRETIKARLGTENVKFLEADVTNRNELKAAFANLAEQALPIFACLNVAGIAGTTKLLNLEAPDSVFEVFDRTIAVNLTGTFNVLVCAAMAMHNNPADDEGQRGVIVNVSSVAAVDGAIGHVGYAGSKAGVAGLMMPAARELARYGIRLNTIAPGFFDTSMTHSIKSAALEKMTTQILYPRRLGKPEEEFGALVGHVLENSYLNAELLRIDGGVRLR